VVSNPNAAPVEAPKVIAPEPPPRALTTSTQGVAGGITGGTGGSVVGMAPPPPPPKQEPVRVGGDIKEPKKIKDVKPIYPQVAMAAKVEGMVIIEATIGKDGSVQDAKILRHVPLLDQAAMDAVKEWKFTPTTLNGQPVEVLMTVTV